MSLENAPPILDLPAVPPSMSEQQDFWKALRSSVRPVHVLIVILLVTISDYLLYQPEGGYSGWSVWTVMTAILLFLGIGSRNFKDKFVCLMSIGFALTSWRLWWQGDAFIAFIAVLQLTWWILALHRLPMEWWRLICFWVLWIPSGLIATPAVFSMGAVTGKKSSWSRCLEIGVPILIGAIFASIFINANPETLALILKIGGKYLASILQLLHHFSLAEFLLWGLLATLALGAMFPSYLKQIFLSLTTAEESPLPNQGNSNPSVRAIAFNTLITLVAIFAIYLVGEVSSMWFREFPEGFHYSGYAHKGAAWLTLALAMTTIVLSVIFRGNWRDWGNSKKLLVLAKIWGAENLVLALCVFNRLWIYVQFNGMTRLRVVGFLGTACVTIGLVLVILKILRNWSFARLINSQIWVVALAAFAAAVFPVDRAIYSYNSHRILSGSYAPSVQIYVQKISNSGYISLLPLMDSKEPIVRDGMRAMLAEKLLDMRDAQAQERTDWRDYQYVDAELFRQLLEIETTLLAPYLNSMSARNGAIEELRAFAMKWY